MKFSSLGSAIVTALAATLTCHGAAAQPASSLPGQLDQRFQQRPTAPSVGAPIEIPATPQGQAPAAAGATFTVTGVAFDGNTVLPGNALQAIAAPYIGRPITLAEANELASKITAAYRDAGYVLVRAVIPAQRVTDGILRIQIVEGTIDKVNIQGDAGGARPYLQAYGSRIAAAKPLTAKVLERQLLLSSDLAGMNVRSVLTASQTTPGAADLSLVVQPKKVDAFVQVDNHGSRFLGPYEIQAGVFFNDALGTGGRLGLNGVVTPDSGPDLAYGGVTFDQPVGYDGLRWFSAFSYAATQPGQQLRAFNTKGNALNASTSLTYPFVRSRDFNFQGSLGLEYHDVRSKNAVINPLFEDHTRNISFGFYMNGLDNWGGYSSLSGSLTRGLPIAGATSFTDPNKSRAGASGEFTRANFEATHEHPFNETFSVYLAAAGQTSFGDPLLSSEQFALGGRRFNRAFDPSELTGDSALAGRIEPRFNLPGSFSFLSGFQLYGFAEGGKVWQSLTLPGQPSSQALGSGGAGLRFAVSQRVSAELEFAKPFERNAFGAGNQDSRFLFSVGTSF